MSTSKIGVGGLIWIQDLHRDQISFVYVQYIQTVVKGIAGSWRVSSGADYFNNAMIITQKNQYAIRAVFELAKRRNQGPVKINEIAQAQKIPTRFLEIILNQLKRSGLLESKRGFYGGYTLIRSPDEITVGEILRMMDASSESLYRITGMVRDDKQFEGSGIFLSMWTKAHKAMIDVLNNTTIQNLLDQSSTAESK